MRLRAPPSFMWYHWLVDVYWQLPCTVSERVAAIGWKGSPFMTAGMAVALFFVGAVMAVAMRVMYELVQRKRGAMGTWQHYGANLVVVLAFMVPSIPGLHYFQEHAGATVFGVGGMVWHVISVAVAVIVSSVCVAAFRWDSIMDEINAQPSDSEGGEQ